MTGISIPRLKDKAGCAHPVTLTETATGVTVHHGGSRKFFKADGWLDAAIAWIAEQDEQFR